MCSREVNLQQCDLNPVANAALDAVPMCNPLKLGIILHSKSRLRVVRERTRALKRRRQGKKAWETPKDAVTYACLRAF